VLFRSFKTSRRERKKGKGAHEKSYFWPEKSKIGTVKIYTPMLNVQNKNKTAITLHFIGTTTFSLNLNIIHKASHQWRLRHFEFSQIRTYLAITEKQHDNLLASSASSNIRNSHF
jgi:hypothetical protein